MIFKHLFFDQDFHNMVYPFIEPRYFQESKYQLVFKKIKEFVDKYHKKPAVDDVKVLLETDETLTREVTDNCHLYLDKVRDNVKIHKNKDFVIDESERWVKSNALELAIVDSMDIVEKKKPTGPIEDLVKKALSISFTSEMGMEYLEDWDNQYAFYTSKDAFFPVDIEVINKALNGGFRRKTISCFVGRTNIGKCVFYNSLISLRNKHTGEIEELSIGEFYDRFQ